MCPKDSKLSHIYLKRIIALALCSPQKRSIRGLCVDVLPMFPLYSLFRYITMCLAIGSFSDTLLPLTWSELICSLMASSNKSHAVFPLSLLENLSHIILRINLSTAPLTKNLHLNICEYNQYAKKCLHSCSCVLGI